MKAALLVGILAISTTLWAQAPNPTQPPNPSEVATSAITGATLQAELIRGIDARKAKPGDPIVARTQQNLNFRGQVLIPRNAKLIGHVVDVQKKGRGKPDSTLTICFDKAILRDGRELPLTASVQALASPPAMAAEVGDVDLSVRNAPAARAHTSSLFPGPIRAARPENSGSTASPDSTNGAVSLQGLQLDSSPTSSGGSVIHSSSENVRLESGTRLILRVSLP